MRERDRRQRDAKWLTINTTIALGKREWENYRNLSEFWRQIAVQLFTDFVAIHTNLKY